MNPRVRTGSFTIRALGEKAEVTGLDERISRQIHDAGVLEVSTKVSELLCAPTGPFNMSESVSRTQISHGMGSAGGTDDSCKLRVATFLLVRGESGSGLLFLWKYT